MKKRCLKIGLFLIIMLTTVVLFFNCNDRKHFQWNLDRERAHNENRNDFTKRDIKTWKADTSSIELLRGKPLINGVFPVPDYSLADETFNGLGISGEWDGFDLKNRKILWHSFYVNQCNVNKEFIPNKPNEVFFTIVALTDTIDTIDYTHTDVSISSRNHPHYIGQGFIKTKTNEIDFISFTTADRNAYAVVNMRLFDLRIGRIVWIAPQKDGTFRSLQYESPIMSSDETDSYIRDLLNDNKEIIDFFTQQDNI